MRLARIALAVAFCAGIALAAPGARAQSSSRLNGTFQVTDTSDPNNSMSIELDGSRFSAEGSATAVNSASGDLAEIDFFTPTPTDVSANDAKARVRQKQFTQLYFFVASDDPAADTDQLVTVEKCDLDASVNMAKGTGSVSLNCSDPNFWVDFTATRIDAIQAAFASNKRVKIKVSNDLLKGGVSITIKGDAFAD